jgi:Transglycosylase SLT domain
MSTGTRLQLILWLALSLCVAPEPYAADVKAPPVRGTDRHAMFRAVGSLYGIDPELLEAIAAVESGGSSVAMSRRGAQGLMQLMPHTAHRFGVSDSFDPVENALGAARFIDHLRLRQASINRRFRLPELLAAYNAGEGAVERYQGVPPYPETQGYVKKVLLRYLFDGASPSAFATIAPRHTAGAGVASPVPFEDPLEQLSKLRWERDSAVHGSRRFAQTAGPK